jgi:hypothetical protein
MHKNNFTFIHLWNIFLSGEVEPVLDEVFDWCQDTTGMTTEQNKNELLSLVGFYPDPLLFVLLRNGWT